MKESYKIVLKHWSKNHPTFFWAAFMAILVVFAIVWFGLIGPICYQTNLDILIWVFNGLTAIFAIFGIAAFASFMND